MVRSMLELQRLLSALKSCSVFSSDTKLVVSRTLNWPTPRCSSAAASPTRDLPRKEAEGKGACAGPASARRGAFLEAVPEQFPSPSPFPWGGRPPASPHPRAASRRTPGGCGPRRPWLSLTRSPARRAPESLCSGRAAMAAVRALLALPPAPRQRPPSAGSGPEACGAGLPPEPGARAGAMLQTKMAAPGKGAQLGPWGAAPPPSPTARRRRFPRRPRRREPLPLVQEPRAQRTSCVPHSSIY